MQQRLDSLVFLLADLPQLKIRFRPPGLVRCFGEHSRCAIARGYRSFPALVERFAASDILDNVTVTMRPEQEKKRELIRELNRRNEQLIATAIDSAMDWRLENEVLYLEYLHPSVNDLILGNPHRRLALDAAAKQIGIAVNVS